MEIRGLLATECSRTEEQIDSTPFPEVIGLFNYWRHYPPTSWLLRQFVGYKPPDQSEDVNIEELPAFLPAVSKSVSTNLPPEVSEYFRRMAHA